MLAQLYIKALGHEVEREVSLHGNICVANYADDPEDFIGYKCGGRIQWEYKDEFGKHGKCQDCRASYLVALPERGLNAN